MFVQRQTSLCSLHEISTATRLVLPGITLAETLTGKVVGVTDGDTLTLLVNRTRFKVRLTEIDTPEKGQTWGSRATQALGKKVFQKDVVVESSGYDRYDRLLGRIWLGDRDINREMVREGHAWAYRRYLTDQSLLEDEAAAKAEQIGLWSVPDPVAPWAWRRGSRSLVVQDFTCGAKTYCREMTSCAEAKFYLQQCGLNRLDGDGDGIPCESICR